MTFDLLSESIEKRRRSETPYDAHAERPRLGRMNMEVVDSFRVPAGFTSDVSPFNGYA
jgi:hypothetical protein